MKLKIILALLLSVPTITMAGVNLKNGDFYITYLMVSDEETATPQTKENHKLELTSTYNSKTWQVGLFGRGWGSRYETHLTVMPDGTAVVVENGTGRQSYYRPDTKPDIDNGVSRIVKSITERDQLSPDMAETLHKELVGNEELRLTKVKAYGIESELPVKTVLHANICGATTELVREQDNYKRVNCDDSKDIFNLQGNLIRHEENDGYIITVNYEEKHPNRIQDSLGQTMNLKTNDKGLIIEASGGNSKHKSTYSYDNSSNLAQLLNWQGAPYGFKYDDRNNMTRINYSDTTSMAIDYYADAKYKDWVRSVTERDGEKDLYEYRSDPKDPNHTWTKVTKFSASGEQESANEVEYQNQTTETGAVQTAQISTSDDKNRTTDTKYDDKQRVISKRDQDGEIIEFTYNPQNGKIATTLKNKLKTDFSFDKKDNLTQIKNSDGHKINLDYFPDSTDIRRIVESDSAKKVKNELRFKYNAAKKPIEVEMVGTGKMTVEYDDKGEISKVDSKQGGMKRP